MYEIRLRHRHRHIKTRICFTLSYTIHVHEIKNNQKFQLYFIKFLEGYFWLKRVVQHLMTDCQPTELVYGPDNPSKSKHRSRMAGQISLVRWAGPFLLSKSWYRLLRFGYINNGRDWKDPEKVPWNVVDKKKQKKNTIRENAEVKSIKENLWFFNKQIEKNK